jgi:hypothetical protein
MFRVDQYSDCDDTARWPCAGHMAMALVEASPLVIPQELVARHGRPMQSFPVAIWDAVKSICR